MRYQSRPVFAPSRHSTIESKAALYRWRAAKTTERPSGDSAIDAGVVVGGVLISRWTSSIRGSTRKYRIIPAAPMATAMSTAHSHKHDAEGPHV